MSKTKHYDNCYYAQAITLILLNDLAYKTQTLTARKPSLQMTLTTLATFLSISANLEKILGGLSGGDGDSQAPKARGLA